jgi:methionine sulfoxide reductase heme-binding subunit
MRLSRGQLLATIGCLIPLLVLIIEYLTKNLTANPIEAATLRTGRTAINLLIFSLACTPIRNIFGLTSFLKIRKTLGLSAFYYAAIHFLIFAGLSFEFNFKWIIDEIRSKLFLQLGFSALILLLLMAITSWQIIQIKMGKSWKSLHRIVYLVAILVLIHYYLAAKGDKSIPIIYAEITLFLLLLRIHPFNKLRFFAKSSLVKTVNSYLLD